LVRAKLSALESVVKAAAIGVGAGPVTEPFNDADELADVVIPATLLRSAVAYVFAIHGH